MIADLTPEMLTGKRFVFGDVGQPPWTDRLILSAAGKVSGYHHPNEAAWIVRDGVLCLTREDGTATTEFDLLTLDGGGASFQGRIPGMNDRTRCLTEYHREVSEPAAVAIANPLRDSAGHDVAVLLWSDKCDAKYDDLKQKLERDRSDFDLYSIVDETRGRPDIPDVDVLWHSLAACRDLGLSHDHQALLYVCADLPFYFAVRELPGYQHYILINENVDMVSGDAAYLNEVARLLADRPELDFVAPLFHEHREMKGWFEACAKVFPQRTWHFAYFPFMVLSRRAAAYLFSQRLIEARRNPAPRDVIHCEAFVATALMAAGFNCIELNELRPGSYAFATMAMQIGDKNIGRPMGYDITLEFMDSVAMVHPIYTPEEYLEHVSRRLGSHRDDLLHELSTPWAATIPQALRDRVTGIGTEDRGPAIQASTPDAHVTGVARVVNLTFGSAGNAARHLGNGWFGPDPGGRWMTGDASEIWLENPGPDHDLVLELDLLPFMPDRKPQRLEIVARGETVLQATIGQNQVVGALIKADLIRAPGPINIVLRHPDHRPPSNHDDTRSLSFAATALRLSRVLPRPSPSGGAPLPPVELVTRFESLGDNCEFGLVQRHTGAEPLGLLRFSYTQLWQLLRGLRNDFAGIDEVEKIEIVLDPPPEYIVIQRNYGLRYHSGVNQKDAAPEQVRARQPTRLKFLLSKLLHDIADAEKIFVIKRAPNLRFDEVLPVWTALNERGRPWLLWATPADDDHPIGHVEIVMPGLLRGYTHRFPPPGESDDRILPGWHAVCAAAWALVGS